METGSSSSGSEPQTAAVGLGTAVLRIGPVPGLRLSPLYHYVLTDAAGEVLIETDVWLADPEPQLALSLPPASGYRISVYTGTADLSDDVRCAATYGPFDVAASRKTVDSLQLICVDYSGGQIVAGQETEPAPFEQ